MRRITSTATTSAASNNWHPMSSQNILRIPPGWRDPNDLKDASSSDERRSQSGQRWPSRRIRGGSRGFVRAIIARTKPLLPPLIRRLGQRCPDWLRRSSELEASLRSFGSRHPGGIRKMFWLDIGCQLLLAAEVVAVLVILRIPFHVGTIFAFDAANRAVKMLTGWMPARIGADEGASAALFLALGLASGAGLALALTRRSRDLLCFAAGFAWLTWHAGFKTSQPGEGLLCKP